MVRLKVLVLFIIISNFSCTKETDKHLFDILAEANFDIPAGLNVFETHYFYIHDIPSTYEQQRGDRGLTDDDVIKILSNRGLIEPRFQDIDYSFIRDISLKLYNAEEPKSEAFYLENIDFSKRNELKMLSSLTNLKIILSKPYFDLEIRINFKTFTPSNTESIIKLNFSAFAAS